MWFEDALQIVKNRNAVWRGHDLLATAEFIVDRVRQFVPANARHLDIACGSGQVLVAFNRVGCRGVGFDLSEKRLGHCKRNGLVVLCADMTATLPFEDESFDLVTLISTLEHVEHPDLLVAEVGRVLGARGVVVIQIPNPRFPIDLHYFLPLYGYCPPSVREVYRKLMVRNGYFISYYTNLISKMDVGRIFGGYRTLCVQDIAYPAQVAPNWLRPFYVLYKPVSRVFPTGHLFVYQKSNGDIQ